MIYFYTIIKEMKDKTYEVYAELEANNLKIKKCDKDILISSLYEFLVKYKIFEVFLNGIKQNLKIKDESFFNDFTEENFIQKLEKCSDISDKEKKELKKKSNSKYFPYVANSGKYGKNSQNEENFHKNLKELLRIVVELGYSHDENEEINVLREYKPTNEKCSVCHTYFSTKYDITHKNEKKERVNSKNNYIFMGSESNTFNNYAMSNSTVCFSCEFFNLMYLLYLKLERPNIIAYTEDLTLMKFINYKIMVNSRKYYDKSFYRELAKYKESKIRLYNVVTDTNKGVLLKFNNVMEFNDIMNEIRLKDMIDNFTFSNESAAKKDLAKIYIANKNNIALNNLLLNELISIDEKRVKNIFYPSVRNIRIYLEFIIYIKKSELNNEQKYLYKYDYLREGKNDLKESEIEELGNEKEGLKKNGFKELGQRLGYKIEDEAKKTIAFKINQLLKSDNRTGMMHTLTHLITVNELRMPNGFADVIFSKDEYGFNYNVGKLLEYFLNTSYKEGEK